MSSRATLGDETDVLQAALDWHRAGRPTSGAFWAALDQTVGALVEAHDREEREAAQDERIPARNSFDAVHEAAE